MNEQWKQVVGYEGVYSVSNLGRVRRDATCTGKPRSRILHGYIEAHGYRVIALSANRATRLVKAHRLVADAFLGECPDGLQINHKDGDKSNNAVNNLEYVTPSKNIQHAYDELGDMGNRKRTPPSVVLAMRKRHEDGLGIAAVAREFCCSMSGASRIINRKRWPNL